MCIWLMSRVQSFQSNARLQYIFIGNASHYPYVEISCDSHDEPAGIKRRRGSVLSGRFAQ